jgi:flavin reductase (DIM6/NTAB) family NADH-FMN oxidoreductase RutF
MNKEELLAMETRYRANLINSLGGFKSVVLIGTRDTNGLENLSIFSSLFHLGANPALCGLIVRPDVSERHTLENIIETGSYTVNHLHKDIAVKAHQTSARYTKEQSEFEQVGLTPLYKEGIYAPFVDESVVRFACEFREKVPLEINGTILVIGEIVHIDIPIEIISESGFVNIEAAGTLTCSGLDSYHTTQKLLQLSYAKPDKWPTEI